MVFLTGNCPTAEILPIYDTPSGSLDVGYFDAITGFSKGALSSSTPLIAAHITGKQAYDECYAPNGDKILVPITQVEFDGYSTKGGKINQAIIQVTSAQTATSTGSAI